MRDGKRTWRLLGATVLAACVAGPVAAAPPAADEVAEAVAQWQVMRREEPDAADFQAAQWRLKALIGTMPATRRMEAVAGMMDRYASPAANAAALEQFGQDPLPITDVQRTLWDSQRSFPQRELLKTYYGFCRAEVRSSILSDATRQRLAAILAERIDNLAGTRIHYGEQRLFVHLCSAVLTRFGRSADQGPVLVAALRKYAEKADNTDGFAVAIPTWLDLLQVPDPAIDGFGPAVRALGHWEPLARLKAAAYLGEQVPNDDKGAQVVLSLLRDPRDEVRAAAAEVFAYAKAYEPGVVVPKMIAALTEDRGVVVQAAAAAALIARADQAAGQTGLLIRVLTDPARRLGNQRTSHILEVLAALVAHASEEQKELLLRLAKLRLAGSPEGALAVLQALGQGAASAAPAVREFRKQADRFLRSRIDRFVLPAIVPPEP